MSIFWKLMQEIKASTKLRFLKAEINLTKTEPDLKGASCIKEYP